MKNIFHISAKLLIYIRNSNTADQASWFVLTRVKLQQTNSSSKQLSSFWKTCSGVTLIWKVGDQARGVLIKWGSVPSLPKSARPLSRPRKLSLWGHGTAWQTLISMEPAYVGVCVCEWMAGLRCSQVWAKKSPVVDLGRANYTRVADSETHLRLWVQPNTMNSLELLCQTAWIHRALDLVVEWNVRLESTQRLVCLSLMLIYLSINTAHCRRRLCLRSW